MAESAESKSIKELANIVKESNEKRDEQLAKDANQEVISQNLIRMLVKQSKGEGKTAERAQKKLDNALNNIQTKAEAEVEIQKQEESNQIQKRLLGVNDETLEKIQNNAAAIDEQKSIMDAQRKIFEKQKIDPEKEDSFKKEQVKLAKMELEQAKLTGSKDAEKAAKEKIGDKTMLGYLKKTAGFLGGIAKQGMEKVKGGLKGFAKFAFGGLAIAALAFLNSPLFDKYYDQIVNVIVPKLVEIYNKILKPLAKYIGGKLKKLFNDILAVIDGKKGIGELIKENLGTLTALTAVLAPKVFFGTLLKGAKLATGLVKAGFTSKAVTGAFAKLAPALKFAIGPAAMVAGIAMAAKDGIEAYKKAGDWDVSKTSAVVGGIFGGQESKGFMGTAANMGKNALKWAAIGAAAGSVIPVIGTAIGGAVGALIGAVLGYFGGDVIAKAIDDMATAVSDFFSDLVKKFKNFFAATFPKLAKIFGMSEKDIGKAAEEDAKSQAEIQNRRQLEMDKVRGGGDAEKGRLMREERAFSQKERQLAKQIEKQKDDVFNRTVGFRILKESKEEQEKDRKKLESLEKEIAELRASKEKEKSAPVTVVDAKSITTDNSSKPQMSSGTNVRNNHPMTRLIESAN